MSKINQEIKKIVKSVRGNNTKSSTITYSEIETILKQTCSAVVRNLEDLKDEEHIRQNRTI